MTDTRPDCPSIILYPSTDMVGAVHEVPAETWLYPVGPYNRHSIAPYARRAVLVENASGDRGYAVTRCAEATS